MYDAYVFTFGHHSGFSVTEVPTAYLEKMAVVHLSGPSGAVASAHIRFELMRRKKTGDRSPAGEIDGWSIPEEKTNKMPKKLPRARHYGSRVKKRRG